MPDGLPDEDALFISDAAPTGFMGADFCNIQRGDVIAVWGCGGVGLMAQQSAMILGAERVIAIDQYPERLAQAEAFGAIPLDFTKVDVMDALKELTGGRGPDACIDAVGMEADSTGTQHAYDRIKQALHMETDRGAALRQAMLAVRKGGTLSILGVYGVMDKFPLGLLMNKGVTVRTAQQHGQAYVPRLLEHALRGEPPHLPKALPTIDAEAVEGIAVSQLFDRRALHARPSPDVLDALEGCDRTRANDLRAISVRQAADLAKTEPHGKVAPACLLQRAVPAARVDAWRPDLDAVVARIAHDLRWRVKTHRLRVHQRGAEHVRVMMLHPRRGVGDLGE